MLEEARLISSPALDAKRLALALAFPHGSPQRLMPLIAPIFSNPRYTDNDVWGLLKMMVKYRVDKDVIGTLVELFISTRRPNYIICPEFLAPQLSARVRTGDVDVAIELLGQFSSLDGLNQVAHASAHAPYVQVLAALQETRTWDSASVNRILDLMSKRGLSLNLPMFNILLSREGRLRHNQSAIAIYSILKQMRIPKIISPDSFTFGSMFLLYRMMHPKSVRKHHLKNPASPFPPRALYRDFMLAAKPKFNEDRVPSTTLMNVILRAFIRQRDYAGAFVVFNSFFLFKVPLDHRTYYRIFKHVVERIWIEAASIQYRTKVGWSLNFLGVRDYRHIKLSRDLLRNLLAFVYRDNFRLISSLYASRRHMPQTNDHLRSVMPSWKVYSFLKIHRTSILIQYH